MSKLDSFIARMQAQRASIELAREWIADVPGVIFELGLGGGRTYDHLRERLPERRVIVFERNVYAPPELRPPPEDLVLGEIAETLPPAAERHRGVVALVHSDVGSGDRSAVQALAALLSTTLPGALAPGGVILSDMALELAGIDEQDLPEGIAPGRYFMYRRPR